MSDELSPLQRRFQRPFAVLMALCGAGLIVAGLLGGAPGLAVPGVVCTVAGLVAIWAAWRGERAPGWARSWTTPRANGPQRLRQLRVALPCGVIMVAASALVLVVGIIRGRPSEVGLGVVGVVFFGASLILVVALLREARTGTGG